MAVIRVQTSLNMVTNVLEDAATNTLYFSTGTTSGDLDAVQAKVYNFYEDVLAIYSALVSQNGHSMKMYNMDLPEPRIPLREVSFNFSAAPAGNPLPTEVAVVASYSADIVGGVPRSSQRGRIYLGPLNVGIPVAATGRVSTATQTLIAASMETLATSVPTMVVYSPTYARFAAVTNGWVDDDFDTQRRRGRQATSRTVWP